MALASATLPMASETFGVVGYIVLLGMITAGYALFQAANNTAVMAGVSGEERGAVSGLLNLSRNLGLITGASAMGAVFVAGSGAVEVTAAPAESIAAGLRTVFAVAAVLIVLAAAATVAGRNRPATVRP
ncbi:hypothetical protein D3C72_1775990 [compost metagenome]